MTFPSFYPPETSIKFYYSSFHMEVTSMGFMTWTLPSIFLKYSTLIQNSSVYAQKIIQIIYKNHLTVAISREEEGKGKF
jgi:hypothetical protein